jgi:hypothetical protein
MSNTNSPQDFGSPKESPAVPVSTLDEAPVRKSTVVGTNPNEMADFFAGISEINDDQRKLLEELYLANGQDAYDAEAAAVGRLKQEEYLALPNDFECPKVAPVNVGRANTRSLFRAKDLCAIYFLNKQRAPPNENAVTYAMLRLEAVKMGWVSGQKEIIRVPFTKYKEAITELATDLATVRTQLDKFRLAAFLIPLVCEHTFRTMGHHYITGLATEYHLRYKKTLKSCLAEEIMSLLQPATLFHHVLHWVSPERAFNVLSAQLETRTLPDAMILRATAAPAGWAIVTTTAAVLQAMTSANIYTDIKEEFDADLDTIIQASEVIKRNVRGWHKAYFAYGVAPPPKAALDGMEEAKNIAIAFAPYAQGFIDGTLKDAALGQAQALKKHSELNPVAKARAARFFRNLARTQVTTVEDLFNTELKRSADDEE